MPEPVYGLVLYKYQSAFSYEPPTVLYAQDAVGHIPQHWASCFAIDKVCH
jgi:hypothetical protein